MSITAITAAPLIQYIIAYKLVNKTNWRGSHFLKNKKVLIGNDHYAEDPCSCWWIMINKPKTANDIILQEAKGILMAHLTGPLAGACGGVVKSVHSVHSTCGNINKAGGMARMAVSKDARSKYAGGIANKLDEAWQAGVWSSVVGTKNEFAIALGHMIFGGAAYFEQKGDDVTIHLRAYDDKKDVVSFMGYAERLGSAGGIEYTREIAEGGTSYKYSGSSCTLT